VAHHSCATNEAAERGLAGELALEFPPPPDDLADALIYCDMTTGPDGQDMIVEQRVGEILARYGPDHLVSRAIIDSTPQLIAAVSRITHKFANPPNRPSPPVL
jgi:hypothetical protein